jgi:hypothetical protein
MKGKMEAAIPKRTKGMPKEEELTRRTARMREKTEMARGDRVAPAKDK